jgi:release factor glutamine methyltransferase
MRIPTNKISSVSNFFYDELLGIYDKSEIENFIFYSFNTFLGFSRTDLMTKPEFRLSESELLKFNNVVKELKKNKPIQYILGSAHFYGFDFYVNENVLIPRPETEELVHLIIKKNKEKEDLSVLDIGTGSGCIAISLKKHLAKSIVTAVDVSEDALLIAEKNAKKYGADVVFKKLDILPAGADLIESFFDLIVSNPPYVLFSEKTSMEKNVLEYEPHKALFVPDKDPLIFYRKIAEFAKKTLNPKGQLYFEINEKKGQETADLLESLGFKNIRLVKDINGKNRILSCIK